MSRYLAAIPALLVLAACSQSEQAEPVAAPDESAAAETTYPAPASRDEDIKHFLAQEYPDADPLKYALAWTDLNGDGSDEAIVHVISPMLCGTGGCNTLVLTAAGPMWQKVGDISVSRTPVAVLDTETNGWRDITVSIGGGGGASGTALLKFDGENYPSNPTVAPAEMTDATGTELLVEEPELFEVKFEDEAAK